MPCCASSPIACTACSTCSRNGRTNAARSNRKWRATKRSPAATSSATRRRIAYKGTVYEHPGVGTKAAFDALTGPRLKAFWDRWYAPNNAVLVIAGDVDPAATLASVRAHFEAIPEKKIPAHQSAQFQPLKRTVIRRATTLAYPLAAIGFRMPGLQDPDFLASFVLQGVLGANRGALHELGDDGLALDGEWTVDALRQRSATRLRRRRARAGQRSRRDGQEARSRS